MGWTIDIRPQEIEVGVPSKTHVYGFNIHVDLSAEGEGATPTDAAQQMLTVLEATVESLRKHVTVHYAH